MTSYKAVYETTGLTIVGPYLKYRPVLNEARSYAQRAVSNVVILEDGKPIMIVRPDGSTVTPGPDYTVGG